MPRRWVLSLSVLVAAFLAGAILATLTPAPAQITPGRPQVINVQHISTVTHVAGLIQAAQSGVWSLTNLQHITSVVHIAAAGAPWGFNLALATRCVNTAATAFEACGGAGGGGDAVNVFHQSTIRHISSVTHVGGTISLVNQAGTYALTLTTSTGDTLSTGTAASLTTSGLTLLSDLAGTWSRAREVASFSTGSLAGTGVFASGLLAQLDDTAPYVPVEGQYSTLRLSSRRALLIEGVSSGASIAIAGDVTSDFSDSGNPVKIGGQARTSLPTAVTNTDRVNAIYDVFGRVITLPHAPRNLVTTNTITLSTTAETTLLTQVASVFLDLVHLRCTNGSGTLVRVDIRDATAGTIRDSIALAASGGGFTETYHVPVPQTTVNNNWTAQLSAAVTDVRCTARAIQNR